MTREEYYERKYKDSLAEKQRLFQQRQQREKERAEEKKQRELEKKQRARYNFLTGADGKDSVFKIIITTLFIILFVRALLGSSFTVSLGGFLEYLANVPDVSLSWLSSIDLTIVADWGVFEFLRIFINSLSSIIEVALMLVGGILQLLTYVTYLLGYIFL